jgi:hypothetical protein
MELHCSLYSVRAAPRSLANIATWDFEASNRKLNKAMWMALEMSVGNRVLPRRLVCNKAANEFK